MYFDDHDDNNKKLDRHDESIAKDQPLSFTVLYSLVV